MKILMPVDGSAYSERAAAFVASRAALMAEHPAIELLHVQAPPLFVGRAAQRSDLRASRAAAAAAVLEPLEDELALAGVEATTRHQTGVPGLAIAARAEAIAADLVVMGSHGRSGLRELVLGSVTQLVLARCRRPVLVLRGKPRVASRPLRLGAALDGSAASRAALRALIGLAPLFGARPSLTLLHVEPPPHLFDARSRRGATPARPGDEGARILTPLRALAARAGIDAREVVLQGWPEEALARHAHQHLDVLAMGFRGRAKVARVVLGSVTSRVAARCEVPLLIARE